MFISSSVNAIKVISRDSPYPQLELAKVANNDNPLQDVIYSDDVLRKMSLNDYHNFPAIVDNYGTYGKISIGYGADGHVYTYINIEGYYRGQAGAFEYIINENNVLTHRFFRGL